MQPSLRKTTIFNGSMAIGAKIQGKIAFSIIWDKPYTQLLLWELFMTIKKWNSFILGVVKLNFLQESKKIKV